MNNFLSLFSNKNHFFKFLLLLITIFAFPHCKQSTELLPNIILIFTDDQGYADLGSYGAEGFTTPNIDQMAAEGIRFTDFYVASSVCSPSRAALLTGSYAQRVGIPDVLAPPGPPWTEGRTNIGLNDDEITIPEMLKQLGYATACFGKWHLGDRKPFLPTRHGFDEYFGLPYSNDMIPENFPPLPLMDGEEVIEYDPDQTKLTTQYTKRALSFIEKNQHNPFFLYVPHSMPHIPLYVSDKFKGKSENGLYGDVIMELDWSVGELMKKLKELNLDDNTLVIYASDNGPWREYGNHAGSAKPLRDGKMTAFEGGQRVPCIMRWPGKIPSGTISTEIASTIDFLPTLAAITGAKLPEVIIDGKNIQSLIENKADAKSPHDAFYYYDSNNLHAIRSGKWKLHLPNTYRVTVEIKNDGERGRMQNYQMELALYNLETDIGEQTNIAAEHPEVVEKLTKMAQEFDSSLKQNSRPAGIDFQ